MNNTKLELAARILHALAHPVRLGVIQELTMGDKTVTELYEALGCSQSMMSQQINIMSQYGLVETCKKGTVKYCKLANPEFLKLFSCIDKHIDNFLVNKQT